MKKILSLLLMLALAIPCLSAAESAGTVLARGETFEAVFPVSGNLPGARMLRVSVSLDPAPIRVADDHLITSFYVRQAEFDEDVADAILILTNLGNVDYADITVLDDVYGGVIADGISLPSGSQPVEVPYTYPLRGESEYRWHITGMNSA